jgi:hypothetical protein
MRLWRLVLETRFDLLSVDANYQLIRDPMPFISIHGTRSGMHVIACHDGPANKLLNIGQFWMRSSNATLELARRVENRTWGAWDQYVVNEELQFNPAFRNVTCCHSVCIKRALADQGELKKSQSSQDLRRSVEGKDQCSASVPDAARPPPASRLMPRNKAKASAHASMHASGGYTKISMRHRRFGRCTLMSQVCPQKVPCLLANMNS